jgi:hypothetical protein
MYSVWTKHLKDEQKEQFNNSILGSKAVLDRAVAILKEEESQLNKAELNHKIYDLPNWDYRIAHDNGFKAALQVAIKLLDLDQQTKENNEQPTR